MYNSVIICNILHVAPKYNIIYNIIPPHVAPSIIPPNLTLCQVYNMI